jgi:hypothetical protein
MNQKIFSWILRGLLLLVALFFMLFSFDAFDGDEPIVHQMVGFFMHNIFTIIFLLILWLSFKRENLAGFALLAISLGMVFFFGPTGIRGGTWLMIGLPAAMGILFLFSHYLNRQKKA